MSRVIARASRLTAKSGLTGVSKGKMVDIVVVRNPGTGTGGPKILEPRG